MTITTPVSTILNRKMDRQDFLKHITIGLVALTGVGAAVRLIAPKYNVDMATSQSYGSSAYGGAQADER